MRLLNKFNCALLLAFLPMFLSVEAQVWVPKSDVPGAQGRWGAYSFSLGDKIYAGGGYVGGGQSFNDLWEYDPITDAWTQKADLPGSSNRTQAIAFTIGNKGYVGLGSEYYNTFNSTFLSDLWEYDAIGNTWTQKASLPDSARHASAVFVVGGKAYTIGGYTSYYTGGKSNDVWEYNPVADQWASKQPYPLPYIYDAQAFTIGDNGYVTGGRTHIDGYTGDRTTKATYRYDQANNTWTQRADYWWNGRDAGVAFSLNGKGYVGMGLSLDSLQIYYVEFAEYDEAADTWTQTASLPVAVGNDRAYGIAATTNGKAYAGCGFVYNNGEIYYNDWFEFTPAGSTSANHPTEDVLVCFPNPTASKVFVRRANSASESTCKLYSPQGICVLTTTVGNDGIVDLDNIPPGLYLMEVASAGKRRIARIAKL